MSVETIREIRDELDETRWEGSVARLRSRPIRAWHDERKTDISWPRCVRMTGQVRMTKKKNSPTLNQVIDTHILWLDPGSWIHHPSVSAPESLYSKGRLMCLHHTGWRERSGGDFPFYGLDEVRVVRAVCECNEACFDAPFTIEWFWHLTRSTCTWIISFWPTGVGGTDANVP